MKPQSFFLAGLLAFMGCTSSQQGTPAAQPAFDFEKVKSYIINDYAPKFSEAFARGDAAGVVALYTADAVMMPPNGESATGTQSMTSVVSSYMTMGAKGIKLTPAEVMGGADGVFETGAYELSGDSARVIDKGKYCALWKEENGTWKIYRDMWNSNLPLPQAAK